MNVAMSSVFPEIISNFVPYLICTIVTTFTFVLTFCPCTPETSKIESICFYRLALCIYELIISDVPLVFYKTKYGMVLCAIGNEESADTDNGEKVRMATSMLVAVDSFVGDKFEILVIDIMILSPK